MKSINECIGIIQRSEKTYKDVAERLGSNHKSYKNWSELAEYYASITFYLKQLRDINDI